MKMSKQKKAQKLFSQLILLMERLRGINGCPWDKHQTHESLIKYLFSEAREVKKAITNKDWKNLEEELGDILLQVVFHSQIASEQKHFDIIDVIKSINNKLIRRHPHVFGGKKLKDPKEVIKQWNLIKKQEKLSKNYK